MVAVLLANGFEEIEALTPVDILRRGGVDVITFGVSGRKVCGAHGIVVEADKTIEEFCANEAEMIILPGGAGYRNLDKYPKMDEMLAHFAERGKTIGAICAAPTILGKRKMLKGKKAVCFPGMEEELIGAEVREESVVKDGNIITAKGAGAAADFGFALLSVLCGEEKSQEIRKVMQYAKK